MKVYVGGKLGQPPYLVTTNFERAIKETISMVAFGLSRVDWRCVYVEEPCEFGDKAEIRWETTVQHGGETFELYVEGFELEDE